MEGPPRSAISAEGGLGGGEISSHNNNNNSNNMRIGEMVGVDLQHSKEEEAFKKKLDVAQFGDTDTGGKSHSASHLYVSQEERKKRPSMIIFLAGDSSLDNKFWLVGQNRRDTTANFEDMLARAEGAEKGEKGEKEEKYSGAQKSEILFELGHPWTKERSNCGFCFFFFLIFFDFFDFFDFLFPIKYGMPNSSPPPCRIC